MRMKRKHGSIRELAECQAKPLPLTPPLRFAPLQHSSDSTRKLRKNRIFNTPRGKDSACAKRLCYSQARCQ